MGNYCRFTNCDGKRKTFVDCKLLSLKVWFGDLKCRLESAILQLFLPALPLGDWRAFSVPGDWYDQGGFDIAVVCSHDTDLSPALDVVRTASTASVHLEVASWSSRNRISYSSDPDKPWCHRLTKVDFDTVKDTHIYP